MNLLLLFASALVAFATFSLHAEKVIVVMGPSCVGKSTTVQILTKLLGPTWHLVDIDEIEVTYKAAEKSVSDEILFKQGIAAAQALLAEDKNVIIDTNIYYLQHELFPSSTKVWHLLLYAPLELLLARDEIRTQKLKRPPEKAYKARAYVITSFEQFFQNTQKQTALVPYDLLLNTSSPSCQASLLTFINSVKNNNQLMLDNVQ